MELGRWAGNNPALICGLLTTVLTPPDERHIRRQRHLSLCVLCVAGILRLEHRASLVLFKRFVDVYRGGVTVRLRFHL